VEPEGKGVIDTFCYEYLYSSGEGGSWRDPGGSWRVLAVAGSCGLLAARGGAGAGGGAGGEVIDTFCYEHLYIGKTKRKKKSKLLFFTFFSYFLTFFKKLKFQKWLRNLIFVIFP
jgi:hypothetical protein